MTIGRVQDPDRAAGTTAGSPLKGMLFMVLASFGFATMAALVKVAAAGVDVFTMVFARSLVIVALVWPLHRSRQLSLKASNRRLMLWRCASGFAAMCCYFYAIERIELATAVTLQYTAPLFVALLGGLILGERLSLRGHVCLVMAFGGTVLLVSPDFSGVEVGALFALASAVLAAFAYLAVRALRVSDPPETIVLHFGIFSLVVSAPILLVVGPSPTGSELLALLGVGAFATMGQLFMTYAYRHAQAAWISAFSYVAVVISAGYGWWLFREVLTPTDAIGAGLILVAGVGLSVTRA